MRIRIRKKKINNDKLIKKLLVGALYLTGVGVSSNIIQLREDSFHL
jgi:hypothetical protein